MRPCCASKRPKIIFLRRPPSLLLHITLTRFNCCLPGDLQCVQGFFFWSLQALKAAWSNGWLRRLDRYAAVCCSSTAPWLPSSSVSLISQHTDRREQEIKATLHVTELHRKESRYQQRVEIMLPSNKVENKFCESLFSNWKEASISFFSESVQVLTLGQALVILGYIRPKR